MIKLTFPAMSLELKTKHSIMDFIYDTATGFVVRK